MIQPSLFEMIVRVALVVLVNGLWQGAAIAGLTWLALRVFPRVNASTRYAAWTLAIVAVLIVPIATSLSRISYYTSPAPTTSTTSSATNPIQKTPAHISQPVAQTAAPSPQRSSLSLPRLPNLNVSVSFLIVGILFTLWGIAALALVVRLAVALFRLERLKRDAMPLGMEYRDQLVQWQRLDAHDRDVRICVTNGIEVPVAVGLFDAMVLLPQHLLAQFDAQEIDQISLHELAHLLRHDDWTNGLQRVITSLLFFNPAVWFIARQMDVEREVACDDYVLELTGAVRTYAFCLTKMAEMTSWPHQPLAAPGVFTTRKNISIRIERLLRTGRAIGSSISPATATLVAVGLIAGYLVAFSLTPDIAFAMPCPPAVAAAPAAPAAPAKPYKVTTPKMALTFPQVSLTVPNVAVTVAPAKIKAMTEKSVAMSTKAASAAAASASLTAASTAMAAAITTAVSTSMSKAYGKSIRVASIDHPGMNCSGCDFENQNLAGKNFAGSNMTGSDFSHSNLQGANFDGANLSGVDFEGADLRNATFNGANLSGANLEGAKLEGANLDHANLSGSDLDVRALSQSQIRAYLPRCNGCDLRGANLSGMDLRGIKLTGVDLSHANLRGANLQDAIFSGVDFSGADLRGANTDGTKFIGCDFSGATLTGP
jgi:uncharacterized protein YjbI with pentapeptide repeats/beta-lactamase regulating signal transducer with metallopeptidase domain